MNRRVRVVIGVLCATLAGGVTTALADSGQFVRGPGSVVFYYGVSAGNARSNDIAGGPTFKFCADTPGVSSNKTFGGSFLRNVPLAPDEVIRSRTAYFSDPRYCSTAVATSSSNDYHTDAVWPYEPAYGAGANGYSRVEAQ